MNPGASLVQIVNPAQVVVNAGMQLSDLQSIAVGDAATITPSQLPDVHLHGTVVAVQCRCHAEMAWKGPSSFPHPISPTILFRSARSRSSTFQRTPTRRGLGADARRCSTSRSRRSSASSVTIGSTSSRWR